MNSNLESLEEAEEQRANDQSIRNSGKFVKLFESPVPEAVDGFICEDREKMKEYWPAGSQTAYTVGGHSNQCPTS